MIDKRVNKPESRLYNMICVHLDAGGILYRDRELCMFNATEWCKEHFGNRQWDDPNIMWYRKGLAYYFRNEDDAIQFKLRWG